MIDVRSSRVARDRRRKQRKHPCLRVVRRILCLLAELCVYSTRLIRFEGRRWRVVRWFVTTHETGRTPCFYVVEVGRSCCLLRADYRGDCSFDSNATFYSRTVEECSRGDLRRSEVQRYLPGKRTVFYRCRISSLLRDPYLVGVGRFLSVLNRRKIVEDSLVFFFIESEGLWASRWGKIVDIVRQLRVECILFKSGLSNFFTLDELLPLLFSPSPDRFPRHVQTTHA